MTGHSALSAPFFHDEAAAYAKLESILWPHGPVCPRCGSLDRITKVRGGRIGLWRCGPCKRQFRVTVGTVFESAHIPLNLWFQAMHLLCASKKGVSSHQIHRILGVTYKTAWFMTHRLREAMAPYADIFKPLGGEGKTVEADETFIGGKERNRHRSKRAKTRLGGSWGKEMVFSLVERQGQVRSMHVPSVSAATLRPILKAQVDDKSLLVTDDAGQYRHMHRDFRHEIVNHGIEEYVRGEAHTNTIEGYFSILKRGIVGVYHHVSQQHLKRYLAEFDFRYNQRIGLGINDGERAELAFRGIVGKRLTYRSADRADGNAPAR
jgi:transposase-like protein